MTRRKLHEVIDRLLDDAAAHPERLGQLKQSLRDTTGRPAPSALAPFAARARRRPVPDLSDDAMWDNMPV